MDKNVSGIAAMSVDQIAGIRVKRDIASVTADAGIFAVIVALSAAGIDADQGDGTGLQVADKNVQPSSWCLQYQAVT